MGDDESQFLGRFINNIFVKLSVQKIVKYKEWEFLVDFDRTKEVYSKMEFGGPETCPCNDCKNFSANRENNIYPAEIKNLFAELGIDYKKESETYHLYRDKNGLHLYGGWFHFKGKILKGRDCKELLTYGGFTFDTVDVTEHFRIAFMKNSSLSFFDDCEKEDLIQVEFMVETEWVIDKSIESE